MAQGDEQDVAAAESEVVELTDLSNHDVTTKYRTISEIVNRALEEVGHACMAGNEIIELCKTGDALIEEGTAGMYNAKKGGKKRVEKGLAFPTCVSVNEICGHFSPLLLEESYKLKDGDIVKVDLGGHIDGFICVAAHTFLVGETEVSSRKADVVKGAWVAATAALRKVQVGLKNSDVTEVINKAAEAYHCTPLQGALSHQLKRYVIDGNQIIIGKESPDEKVDEFCFQVNQVYGLDIIFSTGEGKPRESDRKTTVYKRAVETTYGLKTARGRQFFSEMNKKYPALPFTLRNFEDSMCTRAGVIECQRHDLIHAYPVLTEKSGETVAQFKFTVLLLPGGTKKITGLPFSQERLFNTQLKVEDEELATLLATSVNTKKNNRKNKKDGETVAEAGK
eukprot:TRINITY_DN8446_c0_g1_i1.p1 TRINITY_DN8446_c0_g1~~TRINITY_DN8446_c0_g1_i1.p1  ORF type:complete len:394 (+),score=62.75 TRINITY_DN8446_c0_g1_i1:115-1296(+)